MAQGEGAECGDVNEMVNDINEMIQGSEKEGHLDYDDAHQLLNDNDWYERYGACYRRDAKHFTRFAHPRELAKPYCPALLRGAAWHVGMLRLFFRYDENNRVCGRAIRNY